MVSIQAGEQRFEDIVAIIFDKDGTLADSLPFLYHLAQARIQQVAHRCPEVEADLYRAFGIHKPANQTADAGGDRLPIDAAGLMAVGTRHDNEVAAAAYVAARGHSWGDALSWVKQAFIIADQATSRKARQTPPLAGTLSLCEDLAASGLQLALVSGDTTSHVQDFIACYGLTPWFQVGLGSDGTWAKPHPALLHQTCDQLGVSAEQVLVIGDAQLDQQFAAQGGAAGFISVTWGGSSAIAGADVVLQRPDQLRVVN
jgi:phosphoglycolate phosphatase